MFNMGNMNKMLQQAKEMQKKVEEAQKKLAEMTVEGTAANGKVKLTMTADKKLKEVKIDPSIVVPEDVEILEDLVLTAFSNATDNADKIAKDAMSSATGGMSESFKLPF